MQRPLPDWTMTGAMAVEVVYQEAGRYAAWPANFGLWTWGEEACLVFASGWLDPSARTFHAVDPTRPFDILQARSADGGGSWWVEEFQGRLPGGRAQSVDEHLVPALQSRGSFDIAADFVSVPDGGIDFSDPDGGLLMGRTGLAAGTRSWWYYTRSRGASWNGPVLLPDFGQLGVAARSDYVVLGERRAVFLLTVTTAAGSEGRVCAVETADGGQTFHWRGWVRENVAGYQIMSSTVGCSGWLLSAVRCFDPDREPGHGRHHIDLYRSSDDGRTWTWLGRPVADTGRGGNPPAMTWHGEGRVSLVYGMRAPPFGIRARLSTDLGETWGEEVILSDDGGSHDVGYPVAARLPDDSLLVAGYHTGDPGRERSIRVGRWRPWGS